MPCLVGGGGMWILVWISKVGLLWFEQMLRGSQWVVVGSCKIPIWQSSPSWVWVFKKKLLIWVWFCYGSWFCFEMFLIWVCLRFDVGWLFVWVDLCLIVLLVICWVWLAWAWHRESLRREEERAKRKGWEDWG